MKKVLILLILLIFIKLVNGLNYEISWEESDIINGNEFEITVKVFNLENKLYDGKLWIENNGKIISDTYHNESSWKSSYYYLKEYFKGDDSKDIKLRIDEKYSDFEGNAKIHFRLRNEEEIVKDIIIKKLTKKSEKSSDDKNKNLEKDSNKEYQDNNVNKTIIENNNVKSLNNKTKIIETITNNNQVIKLGNINNENKTENIKSQIIYESKTEIIKKYSVYGFALLCVILCVLIIWRKI